jgi:predicted transcriptional regulator
LEKAIEEEITEKEKTGERLRDWLAREEDGEASQEPEFHPNYRNYVR